MNVTLMLGMLGIVAVVCALAWFVGSLLPAGRDKGSTARQRDHSADWGSARDKTVKDLLADDGRWAYDRITLGRLGKRWVTAAPRASVALFAPTLSGKTTAFMVPRVLEWDGALVATSAKADLVRLTMAHRAQQGPVYVFDPLGFLADVGIRSCHWSPLMGIRTYADALMAASWLTSTSRVAGQSGESMKFWDDNAKRMIGPLLFAAAQNPTVDADTGELTHERHIAQVGRWLQRGQVSDPEVETVLRAAGDRDALDAFAGVKSADFKTRQNIATTAQGVLDPFAHPRTRDALTPTNRAGEDFDPDRVLDEGGTLYVFAPEHEAEEFKPLFETIINTIVFAAQDRSARRGGLPIEPHHLLLALDEAANMASLRKMPELASVGSSQGIVLLSVWQNTSQIETIYGSTRARTLLAGHNGRVFWGGIQDEETLKYVQAMAGEFEARRVTHSHDQRGRSSSTVMETKPLAPTHFVRGLDNNQLIVLFKNIKPLRLQVTPWFKDDEIRSLVDPDVAAEFDRAFAAGGDKRPAGRVHRTAGSHDG